MELKTILIEDIGREHQYLLSQTVGSEGYNDSLKRLNTLESKLFDLEKLESETAIKTRQLTLDSNKFETETASKEKLAEFEAKKFEYETASKEQQVKDEKRDKRIKNAIEIAKIVSGIVIPTTGLIAIMAFEKEETFTSALKGYVNCFIPKKSI